MKRSARMAQWAFLLLAATATGNAQNLVINELMYHPSSEDPREEYVELFNAGPTNVSLSGWRISGGIDFNFPTNASIGAGKFLVVAARVSSFNAKYPGVTNVVGGWLTTSVTYILERSLTNHTPTLSNRRNSINLRNAADDTIDSVTYADEGDWAVRQKGPVDNGQSGWLWTTAADGLGSSLELINPALRNDSGQNWTSSLTLEGTPGTTNSVRSTNVAPLILETKHLPVIPRSSEQVSISARIVDDAAGAVTVTLWLRTNSAAPTAFVSRPMLDNGMNGDGAMNDGIYGALLGPLPNNTLIEFYVQAADAQANSRTWPPPALSVTNTSLGQTNNALFQVDDTVYTGTAPLYKLIITAEETAQLTTIFNSNPQSDAEVSATFISVEATGIECRYRTGIRNRGNSSRNGTPHNYHVHFARDNPWKDISSMNLNARAPQLQHLGAVLAQKSGVAGANASAVQLRVNNGAGPGGTPGGNHYSANEAVNGDWADRHFPFNNGGNIYKMIRNISPSAFEYRGEDPTPYRHTYFKESNVPEDDWTDLIGMLSVMGVQFSSEGEPNPEAFTAESVRQVINVEQWLRHTAFMAIVGNSESGLNSGHNDDYQMYRGVNDPRFILIYWDLDQLFDLGGQNVGTGDGLFGSTNQPPRGSGDDEGLGQAFTQLLGSPDFQPLYFEIVKELLDTVFAPAQFNALVDQTLGHYAQAGVISSIKSWIAARRTSLLSQYAANFPPNLRAPIATITGEPRSPTPNSAATLTVGGAGVTHYRHRVNSGVYGAETPVATPIAVGGVVPGNTNTVYVIGKGTNGVWQSTNTPTRSKPWVVITSWPTVRLNEVLALNNSAFNHFGTFPDVIELYNEGGSTVDLTGMRLTDDPADPDKFIFPSTSLAAGAYLRVFANNADGTPGLHTGFGLGQNGDAVYLFHKVTSGGALLDSVTFGLQLPNLSIGRNGTSGTWRLGTPSVNATNTPQALGSQATLKINEWLAASQPPTTEDFIELYNPDPLPVALGGMYLTDEPIGAPALHRIADLSFIAGSGFALLTADGSPGGGAEHVDFRLASELGNIGLFDANLALIDCVTYGPQRPDVSMGRCPDGGVTAGFSSINTPGAANFCPAPPPGPLMVNLLPLNATWRYLQSSLQSNNLDGVNWQDPAYNDSAWPSGQAVLGVGSPVPEPVLTPLTSSSANITYYFRSSFTVPTNFNPTSLQFSNIIDDGAIFYLNGREVARYNMPAGPVTNQTAPSQGMGGPPPWTGPIQIALTNVMPGLNTIAVEVHNATPYGDVFMGTRLDGVIVTNSASAVVINEIQANNPPGGLNGGPNSDWVEFYNPSMSAVDLSDLSLSDKPADARRYVFPPGSVVPAQGYLVINFDGDLPSSSTNTGFGLNNNGDSVYFFKKPADGGGVLDAITFGLQIEQFTIGRFPNGGTNWALTTPTLGAANLAATPGDPTLLRINEWMADPAGGDDWFELFNGDTRPVALANLRLTDILGNPNSYRIPALSFIGIGSNAFTRFEADEPSTPAGAEHVNFKLSKDGDSIFLLATNNGTQIDSVGFGQQTNGVSQGRLPDGATNIVFFPETPTPANANYLPLPSVVVNEVLAHTDLPLEDAVELRNLTGQPINIGGWYLSDANDTLLKFRIADDTMLPAFGFKVFYEVDFNNDLAGTPFSLSSANGDEVYLSQMTTNGVLTGYRAVAKFGPSANGVSFGRYANSQAQVDYVAMSALSLGTAVTAQSPTNQITVFRTGAGATNPYPQVGPVIINEVMYHPPDLIVPGVSTNDVTVEEFIELKNTGAYTVPLYDTARPTNGWRLRDAVDFTFTSAHSIPPGGHLIVVGFDPATNGATLTQFRAKYGSNFTLAGPWIGKLDNSSDSVELVRPDAPQLNGDVPRILVEKVVYQDKSPWSTNADGLGQSLQRLSATGYANDVTNWLAAAPAPGPFGDSDGDGMPDQWEMDNGLNKNFSGDAGLDPDLDGMTNLQEYLAGTNPQSAASALRLTATLNAGGVDLSFTAVAGRTYTILYADAMPSGGNWQWLTDVPAQGVTGAFIVHDVSNQTGAQRYYRIVTPAVP